jgi:plastocyanin
VDATDQHKENDMQKWIIITVMAVAVVATVSRGLVSADDGKKVDIKGLETFETNALFLSNLRFAPENIKVEKGDTVTWKDDALTSVPHTITIFDPTVLPGDFATAYICNWDRESSGLMVLACSLWTPTERYLSLRPWSTSSARDSTLLATRSFCHRMAPSVLRLRPARHHPPLHLYYPSVDAGFDYGRRGAAKEVKTSRNSEPAKRSLTAGAFTRCRFIGSPPRSR